MRIACLVIPSPLHFFALVALGLESLRPPAGALDAKFAGYRILVAPLLETALMFPVAFLLGLLIPRHRRVQIALLAIICAFAHRLGGGRRQVFATFWPFLIYSAILTTWLKHSPLNAFWLTALVHALYNGTFFGVGALGSMLAGPGGSTDEAWTLPRTIAR